MKKNLTFIICFRIFLFRILQEITRYNKLEQAVKLVLNLSPITLVQIKERIYDMGLFSKILEKIGIGKKEAKPQSASTGLGGKPVVKPAATVAPVKPAVKPGIKPATTPRPAQEGLTNRELAKPAPAPVAISEVDVVKKLEELGKGKKLDWKVSIVDLLKLLDIDSSFAARKELATELGCPADLMKDSAKMNVWLHKEVLRQIAVNGGNIPKELLD